MSAEWEITIAGGKVAIDGHATPIECGEGIGYLTAYLRAIEWWMDEGLGEVEVVRDASGDIGLVRWDEGKAINIEWGFAPLFGED